MKVTAAALSLAVIMGISISANATPINYVYNGDFETLSGSNESYKGLINGTLLSELGTDNHARWDVYDKIPGWDSGENDAGIEVQTDGTVVYGHSSSHYIELDSHGTNSNSSMSQTVTLDPGVYDLSFWYRPRTDSESDNNIDVFFGPSLIGSATGVSNVITDWTLYSYSLSVEAAGGWVLMFEATGRENTLGGFVDDVSIVSAPVPEPATIILLGAMGLVGLAGSRIRKKKK